MTKPKNVSQGPKITMKNESEASTSAHWKEADFVAKSAESVAIGKGKGGRPSGPEPIKNIGISLPVRLIEALDKLAAERTGRNRSLALAEVLDGKLELPK